LGSSAGAFFLRPLPGRLLAAVAKDSEYAQSLGFIRHMTLLHVMNEEIPEADRSRREEECPAAARCNRFPGLPHGVSGLQPSSPGQSCSRDRKGCEELDVSLIMIARLGQSIISGCPIGRLARRVCCTAERPLFHREPPHQPECLGKGALRTIFPMQKTLSRVPPAEGRPGHDRVFGVFGREYPRCRSPLQAHSDGLEVDAVYDTG